MKKTFILCSLFFVLAAFGGTTAFAQAPSVTPPSGTSPYYNMVDVTWIGTTAEYEKTLKAFFDFECRIVPVGDLKADGTLGNVKYGIVKSDGSWLAQPIYDKIEPTFFRPKFGQWVSYNDTRRERIFFDRYIQVTRGGKMGLFDRIGAAEVIPCNYDGVGMPVEGMCRLINKNKVGYWNLELGKEIVAPKYSMGVQVSANFSWGEATWNSKIPDQGGCDFNGGYAMVYTEKRDKVTIHDVNLVSGWVTNKPGEILKTELLAYAQIIDKNGKEILPQAYPTSKRNEFQAGPYMVYSVVANEPNAFRDTTHGDIRGTFELTKGGIVGEKGIIVSAEYNNRVDTGSSNLAYRYARTIGIIPELSLYIYSDGSHLAAHYNVRSGETVLKDFTTNKTVFTFKHTEGWSNIDLTGGYYSSEKVFFLGKYLGRDGTQKSYLVRIDGTIVPNVEASVTYEDKQNNLQQRVSLKATFIDFTEPVNGHTVIMERVNFDDYVNKANSYKTVKVKNIVSLSTGTVYKHTNLEGSECSDVSVNNTLWVNKGNDTEQKWGLVDLQGKVLLPFEYEICNQRDNYVENYGGGGRIKIWPEWNRKENAYMAVKKNGSSTVEWLDTMGKPFTGRIYTVPEGWDLSKHIPATNRGLEYRKPPNRLAYLSAGDYYGPEGKIVFPEAEIKSYDAEKNGLRGCRP